MASLTTILYNHGPNGSVWVVLVGALEDPKECAAHNVLGQGEIVGDEIGGAQSLGLVPVDQGTEGVDIALPQSLHLSLVVHVSGPRAFGLVHM